VALLRMELAVAEWRLS